MGALVALALIVLVVVFARNAAKDESGDQAGDAGGIGTSPASPVIFSSPSGVSHNSDVLGNIGQAIFQFEGGQPGNRNVVNNNPGNLRAGTGQTGTAGGYATFTDVGDGWDALNSWVTSHSDAHPDWDFYDLFDYYLRGSTTAPAVDAQGDSNAYADYVASYLGVDPTTPVSGLLGS